jgi:CHAT domain-containing protein/tetratricopeptide (TPR) repeat protein
MWTSRNDDAARPGHGLSGVGAAFAAAGWLAMVVGLHAQAPLPAPVAGLLAEIERVASATDVQVEVLDRAVASAAATASPAVALALHEAWASCLVSRLYRLRDGERALLRARDSAQALAPADAAASARVLIELADLHRDVGERPAAAAEYDRAEALLNELHDEQGLARLALGRAALLADIGHTAVALLEANRAQEFFARHADRGRLARSELVRGRCLTIMCRYYEALDTLERAAQIRRELGDEVQAAFVDISLIPVLMALDRYGEALVASARARAALERRGCLHGMAQLRLPLAHLLQTFGRFDEAIAECEAAEPAFSRFGDRPGVVMAKSRRCDIYRQMPGRQADFQRCLGDLEHDAEGLDDLRIQANLASLREAHDVAAARFAQMDNQRMRWVAICNHARSQNNAGRYEEALEAYARAEAFFSGIGDRKSLADVLLLRGLVYGNQSRHREGLAEDLKAVALIEHELRMEVQHIGTGASRSFRAKHHWALNNVIGTLGRLTDQTPEEIAAAYHARQVFYGVGLCEARAGPGGETRASLPPDLQSAADAIESALRTKVRERERLAFDTAEPGGYARADLLAAVGNDVDRLERQHAMLFEEARLRTGDRAAGSVPFPAHLHEVQRLLPAGVALAEYTIALSASGNAGLFVVTRRSAVFRELGEPPEVTAAAERVARLLAGGPRQEAFDVEVAAALRELGRQVVDPLLGALPSGFELRTLLVSPDGALCRVPFEVLLTANLETQDRPSDWPFVLNRCAVAYVHSGTTLRDTVLARGDGRAASPSLQFVAFAHPSYAGGRRAPSDTALAALGHTARWGALDPLPGTAEEVLRIALLLAETPAERTALTWLIARVQTDQLDAAAPILGNRFALFLRDAASEANLERDAAVARADILHLACHGFADPGTPYLSHLALSQSPQLEQETGEDGYVVLNELRRLRLDAELLTLSGCETSAGRFQPHEGIESLARAGLEAGARAVLATLWQVRDQSARALMEAFYRGWLIDGLSRTEALANAKRAAIARGVDFRQWSAFVLWDADQGSAPGANPPDASGAEQQAAWQERLAAATRATDYEFTAAPAGGRRATNRACNLVTLVTAGGVEMASLVSPSCKVGLRTNRLGRARRMRQVEAGEAASIGNRAEIRRAGLVEWYANDARGIGQGFRLDERPDGEGALWLEQELHGDASAELVGEVLTLRSPSEGTVLSCTGVAAVDANGKALPARLVVERTTLRIESEDRDAVYPLTFELLHSAGTEPVAGGADRRR